MLQAAGALRCEHRSGPRSFGQPRGSYPWALDEDVQIAADLRNASEKQCALTNVKRSRHYKFKSAIKAITTHGIVFRIELRGFFNLGFISKTGAYSMVPSVLPHFCTPS